jgi:type VI secretion system protein ImpG
MDRRFLRYYEDELRFVRDLAGEFASDHARVADRFGLGPDSCADPHVEWLLDGFAFLAARVHLKLDGEHERFTHHLLEMVYPGLLCPTPAAAIVRFEPEPNPAPLEGGYEIPRGSRLFGRPAAGEQTRCTFTTAHPVTLWPIRLEAARYLSGPALAAAGLGAGRVEAALHLRLRTTGEAALDRLALDRLPLHLAGNDRLAHRLYEALVAHACGILARPADTDDAAPTRLGPEAVRRLGFAEEDALYPPAPLGFSGYRLLREYFTLPERFLFVALEGLAPAMRRTAGTGLDLFVLLDAADPVLAGAVTAAQLALFATPVLNLFPRRAKPILLEPHERDHLVVGDRVRPLDYEIWDVTAVAGFGADERDRHVFTRFYHTDHGADPSRERAFWAVERRARLVGRERRREKARSSYLGTDLFLSLCDGNAAPWPAGLRRLDVETLCTNRDLPMRLPLPQGESHLTSEQGGPIAAIHVLGRLTAPRESVAAADPAGGGPHGQVAWRLIGHLALNYLSLLDGPGEEGADALRSLLALYADRAEPALVRQIPGVRSVRAARVTRRLPGDGPIAFGRGLEITLDLAEAAFQDGSAFLLGSVLEVFFRRYVALNSFAQTVLRTGERGEIMRFPPQMGARALA